MKTYLTATCKNLKAVIVAETKEEIITIAKILRLNWKNIGIVQFSASYKESEITHVLTTNEFKNPILESIN